MPNLSDETSIVQDMLRLGRSKEMGYLLATLMLENIPIATPKKLSPRNSNSKMPQVSFNAARPSFTARICSLLVDSFTPIITSHQNAAGRNRKKERVPMGSLCTHLASMGKPKAPAVLQSTDHRGNSSYRNSSIFILGVTPLGSVLETFDWNETHLDSNIRSDMLD